MMDCNSEIHVELIIIWNNLVVHFVMATSRKHNANVCQCCGQVDRYEIVNEFVPISS